VIRYVDAFHTDPGGLADRQRPELLEHFSAEQLVELTAAVALFFGFSKIAIALGPPPDMPTQVVPTPGVPDEGQS
jgi:alkylhydroperoxidase family enzyme